METVKKSGRDMADQLVSCIEKSVRIRQNVDSVNTQIANVSFSEPMDLNKFFSATNVISFDGDLQKLLPFINYYSVLINQKANEKINILMVLQDAKNNIDSIGETFQKLLDSEIYLEDTHISVVITELLEHLHEDAN